MNGKSETKFLSSFLVATLGKVVRWSADKTILLWRERVKLSLMKHLKPFMIFPILVLLILGSLPQTVRAAPARQATSQLPGLCGVVQMESIGNLTYPVLTTCASGERLRWMGPFTGGIAGNKVYHLKNPVIQTLDLPIKTEKGLITRDITSVSGYYEISGCAACPVSAATVTPFSPTATPLPTLFPTPTPTLTAARAAFKVNSFADAADAAPGNGACAAANGQCTLRAAIMEANALAGADQINLPGGTYTLSLLGIDEEQGAAGDLNINGSLLIEADNSVRRVVVDGGGLDRIFSIRPAEKGAVVHLHGLILQGGKSIREGGGVLIQPSGADVKVVLDEIWLQQNAAVSGGGVAVLSAAQVVVQNSTLSGNQALLRGGALYNQGGSLTLVNVTMDGNQAQFGGGLFQQSGLAALANLTLTRNSAQESGGGLDLENGSTLVRNSLIYGNTAPNGPDCIAQAGGLSSQGYNLLGNPTACLFMALNSDRSAVDPLLGELQMNGGLVPSRALDPASPLVDGGDPAGCSDAAATRDARGSFRPRDGNLDGKRVCDPGAYEYDELVVTATSQQLPAVPCPASGITRAIFLPDALTSFLSNAPDPAKVECKARTQGEVWMDVLQMLSSRLDPASPVGLYLKTKLILPWDMTPLQLNPDASAANTCDHISASQIMSLDHFWRTLVYTNDDSAPMQRLKQAAEDLRDLDVYRSFLETWSAPGGLTPFPYDWRMSLEDNARQLDAYLACNQGTRVTLIAHGTGGLVARQYISDPARAIRIEKIISVGTPYLGDTLTALDLRSGSTPVEDINHLVDRDLMRAVYRNSPGIIQSLPFEAAFQLEPRGYWFAGRWLESWADTQANFTANGENEALFEQARRAQARITGLGDVYGVPVYVLFSTNQITPAGIREFTCREDQSGQCLSVERYAVGDGRVTWASAQLSGRPEWMGQAAFCNIRTAQADHLHLMADPAVQTVIAAIQAGQGFPQGLCGGSAGSGAGTAAAVKPQTVQTFTRLSLWGDAALRISDAAGRTAEIDDLGLVINTIPGLRYDIVPGGMQVILPSAGTVSVQLQGQSNAANGLRIEKFSLDQSGSRYTRQETSVMNDLAVPQPAGAFLHLPADAMGLATLTVDDQNDGKIDRVFTAVKLEGEAISDILAPVTALTVQGRQNPGGFLGNITLVLTASDLGGSGLLRTEYSFDGGQTWQLYTEPVTVDARIGTEVLARSIDRAGNQEYPWQRQALVFQPAAQPTATPTAAVEMPDYSMWIAIGVFLLVMVVFIVGAVALFSGRR